MDTDKVVVTTVLYKVVTYVLRQGRLAHMVWKVQRATIRSSSSSWAVEANNTTIDLESDECIRELTW